MMITQEQIEVLCRLDPDHFRYDEGLDRAGPQYRKPGYDFCPHGVDSQNIRIFGRGQFIPKTAYGHYVWWMLEQIKSTKSSCEEEIRLLENFGVCQIRDLTPEYVINTYIQTKTFENK